MTRIAENLIAIHRRMAAASRAAGREPNTVLVAVSKTQPEAAVRAALAAGQKIFGENRVQEAEAKFAALRAEGASLELHLIGPLQTNKAEEAVRLFDVIETLDRPKLAEALAKAVRKTRCAPRFLIEVNIGNEPQKAGVAPADFPAFLDFCRRDCGLDIKGLMCIPPQGEEPEKYFRQLAALAAPHALSALSMGMSADFEIAIRCGATHVRIGTALFGERKK